MYKFKLLQWWTTKVEARIEWINKSSYPSISRDFFQYYSLSSVRLYQDVRGYPNRALAFLLAFLEPPDWIER
jgi:hypothetical protein